MFWNVLKFEAAYHLKRPVTWLYALFFFLMAFFFLASDAILIGGGVGLVRKNSPYSLTQVVIILTAVGQVITTAVVGTAVLRDFNFKTHELLFTTRLTRWSYLGGRFFGAFAVMLIVYCAIPIGAAAGTMMPWVDAEKLLPFNAWHYLQPFLLFGVTDLFLISAIFFAVGALTRNIFAIYVQGILLLVIYSVTQEWLNGLDKDGLANAFDAFGMASVDLTTRYWTVTEKNTQLLALEGLVLTNRLIWLGAAILIGAVTILLFRFESAPATMRLPWRRRKAAEQSQSRAAAEATPIPSVTATFDARAHMAQLFSVSRFSFLRIVRDIAFLAIAAIGGINLFMSAWYSDSLYGVTTWPVTYIVAEVVAQSFFIYMLILSTIYAGESVWRERSLGVDQIADSMPVGTATIAIGKMIGVILAQAALLVVLMFVGLAVQTFKGYTDYQFVLYLKFLFGATFPWMVAITLFSFAVHALVDNKFLGHVILIGYWIATVAMSSLGLEHQLYQYGTPPGFTYSDMNGFGHYVANMVLSAGVWNAIGLMFVVLAILTWRRGTVAANSERMRVARERWPSLRLATGGSAFLSLALVVVILYNTNILNTYETSDDANAALAEWERTYKQYEHLAPPRVVAMDVRIDIVPERRAYVVAGRYAMRNRETVAIDSILVNYDSGLTLDSIVFDRPARRAIDDQESGTLLYVLEQPLAPGDSMEVGYRFRYAAIGFPNAGSNTSIVANGSFISDLGPSFGYNPGSEMADDDERRKQDLPPRERLPDLDDPAARRNHQLSIDSDAIRFAVTVSTAPDQIAVAPGYLVREWMENGRRVFRYEMDRPIANFATVVSARYEVHRDRWRDVDIEIYHHSGHVYNLERMTESVKASLEYYTANFSPYQYRFVRIVEFPRYQTFAQAFPGTVPYSEGIGFIARVRDDDDDLDMPFFVTAHEVAHMWWGHQVMGARAQGSSMLVESMAEYSALTVMEKRYGAGSVQKFLRHELDQYLTGRSNERKKEQPLIRTENQGYIHYYKGSLTLYALRDYIGEDAMNRALRRFLTDRAYETAPYSTARDFVAYLSAETPDSLKYVITDLFETITLYDNRTDEASVTRRADGKYVVALDVHASKARADSVGNETGIPVQDYIEIGVFGEKQEGNTLGKPLYVQKHRITAEKTRIEVIVDEAPRKAGIDPYNKLIDRVPGDNVKDLGAPSTG